jgi:uncharacterized protein (TIGR03435 family)
MFACLKRLLAAAGCVAAAAVVFGPMGYAQTTSKPISFDAASIRKNVDNIGKCTPDQLQATPSGFRMTNCPLMMALVTAYVPTTGEALGFLVGDRIVGMPDWMRSERYDIDARISEADAEAWKNPVRQKEMLRAMLQTLLGERCNLAALREMKDKPTYALVLGKNGLKLKAAETADLDALHARYPNAMALPGTGGLFAPGKNGGTDLYGVTTGTLSLVLSSDYAGRPVVDKTGLSGRYNIQLPRQQSLTAADDAGADAAPTIFAVLEGLGLKLETQKNQVEMLVVDHVERPSEN